MYEKHKNCSNPSGQTIVPLGALAPGPQKGSNRVLGGLFLDSATG